MKIVEFYLRNCIPKSGTRLYEQARKGKTPLLAWVHDHQSIDESTVEHSSWDLRNTAAGLTAFTSMPYLRPHLATWFNKAPTLTFSSLGLLSQDHRFRVKFIDFLYLYSTPIYIYIQACMSSTFSTSILVSMTKRIEFPTVVSQINYNRFTRYYIFNTSKVERKISLLYCSVLFRFPSRKKGQKFFPAQFSLSRVYVCMCLYSK